MKYEGTSSNKIIAANRKEEKYKRTQQHDRSVENKLIAAGEKGNGGVERDGTQCHK